MKKNAFTLAETLVTLLVIGIVIVMVIPMVQTTIAKKEFIVMAKKAFANISQSYKITLDSDNPELSKVQTDEDLANHYFRFLPKITEVAPTPDDMGGYGFYTVDGAYYSFHVDEPGCGGGYQDEDGNLYEKSKCYVTVDVNGLKKGPNTQAAIVNSKLEMSDRVTFLIAPEVIKPNCVAYYVINDRSSAENFKCGNSGE